MTSMSEINMEVIIAFYVCLDYYLFGCLLWTSNSKDKLFSITKKSAEKCIGCLEFLYDFIK